MTERERLKKLNDLWCELSRKKPGVAVLETILRRIPELREKVAEALLKENLSRQQLFYIVMGVPLFAERAGRRLLKENLSSHDFVLIMEHVPRLRRRAWGMFLAVKPTNEIMRDALYRIPQFRKKIIRILLAGDLDEYTLLSVLRHATSKTVIQRVTERILNSRNVSRIGLIGVIEHSFSRALRRDAAEKMLKMPISGEDLFVIMKHVPSLRISAWTMLITKCHREDVVRVAQRVLKEIPALRSYAKKVLRTSHVLIEEMIRLSKNKHT